jgi:hypothetical protein
VRVRWESASRRARFAPALALALLGCTGAIITNPETAKLPDPSTTGAPAQMTPANSPAPPPAAAPPAFAIPATARDPMATFSAGDLVTLHSPEEAIARRQALIQYLWGSDGFPSTKLPTSVDLNIASPVTGLSNLGRVDELHFEMDAGVETFAYHFIPASGNQTRAVILHQGHSPVLDDDHSLADVSYGLQRAIDNLLVEGYGVLAMFMPGCLPPATTCDIPHAQIVELPTVGSGIKFFLEPVARGLNYLATQAATDGFTAYDDFAMVGLSGGGWTTTVYAAIDPRITLSIPVAGSLPLPMRNAVGDEEQFYPALYAIADYPDLYALGAFGANRRQVQVLNRHDDCCFGESPAEYSDEGTGRSFDTSVRAYELDVRKVLARLGEGSFRLEIDEAAPAHMISWNTIASIILAELKGDTTARVARVAGTTNLPAAPTAATPTPGAGSFMRSTAGTLLRAGAAGDVEDTGIAIVGAPSWAPLDAGGYEVFARDPLDRLIHAVKVGAAWTVESLGAVVITDPVMIRAADDTRFDVAALTTSYLPGHWSQTGASWVSEIVADAPKTFGLPHLHEAIEGQLELVARDFTHTTFRLEDDGTGTWTPVPTAPPTTPPPAGP